MQYNPQSPFPMDGLVATGHETEEEYPGPRVTVMNQFEAQQYTPQDHEVCISITSDANMAFAPRPAILSDKFEDILRLEFDDVAVQQVGDETATSISKEQSVKVVEFVQRHLDKKHLVIHCFAGISRSRSIAAAICQHFALPYKFTALNSHVYNSILWAANRP